MRREQLHTFREWFDSYVKSFYRDRDLNIAGIRLKEAHTSRVCGNIVRIGQSLGLRDEDLAMAEAIALFHDVGRFRQFSLYRTFNDRRSENHARLGVRELEQSGILSGVKDGEKDIITTAVLCHNMLDLPDGLQGPGLLFAKMIRDADKLDILEVFTGHFVRPDSDLGQVIEAASLPEDPGYSPVLAESLLRGERCSYEDMKTRNDRKLLLLSWIYDINFPFTLAEIATNGYVEKIVQSLPRTEDVRKIGLHLGSYLARRVV